MKLTAGYANRSCLDAVPDEGACRIFAHAEYEPEKQLIT